MTSYSSEIATRTTYARRGRLVGEGNANGKAASDSCEIGSNKREHVIFHYLAQSVSKRPSKMPGLRFFQDQSEMEGRAIGVPPLR